MESKGVDSAPRHPAKWPPATSSELRTHGAADRYDAEETEMSSAAVLEPTLTLLAELAGDGRALESATGTGRVGVPLRERSVPVVGIELSEHLAAVLRRKIDEDALPVVIGDMAAISAPGEFTLVSLVHHTITHLVSEDEQVECFRNAARRLAPGGRCVIEPGVPPLRFLPPGQVAVPFDVFVRHIGFGPFDLVEQFSSHTTSPTRATTIATAAATPDTGTPGRQSSTCWHGPLGSTGTSRGGLRRGAVHPDSAKHVSVWRKPT
ncbi:methyltransferase [Streptomyces albospinus]|uniref:Methyltransferase n=1 Tax=Streptomyces albospinus TaxID=285515 RepID=A0ABQ2UV96_9ACTN|nr:methyltransferase [Streptomyces albospinus]